MEPGDALLASPPTEPRALELWMQHGAGFILVKNIRDYARERIDSTLDSAARDASLKAIDDALYGLMMIIEGIPAPFQNESERLELEMRVRLSRRLGDIEIASLSLAQGDGMCMGYHGWIEGDFGDQPLTADI